MKNNETKVPTIIPTTMVKDNGNCKSAPMEPRERNGNMAKTVVAEVITMGRSL